MSEPRTRRRTGTRHRSFAAAAAGVLLTGGLASCSSPAAVDQEEISHRMITQQEFDGDGWTAGSISEAPPKGGEDGLAALLKETTGTPDSCRTALGSFSAGLEKSTAFATLTFAHRDSTPQLPRELTVGLRAFAEEKPQPTDLRAAAKKCPSFEMQSAKEKISVTVRSPTYEVPDSEGISFDLAAGNQKIAMDMVRVYRGPHLVTVSMVGTDSEANAKLLAKVAERQMKKLEG